MTNALLSRRTLLKTGGAALAGAGFLPSLAATATAGTGGYKALVCILLAGGCDSFNLLMPSGGAARSAYERARTNLAIDATAGHAITDANSGDAFTVHPATEKLQRLYNDRRLAFISNIGPLAEPTTKDGYLSGSAVLPKGLLSHKDQIQHWQTSVPQDRAAKGFAGRANDLLSETQGTPQISRTISLSGTNVYQYAKDTAEYAITSTGSVGLDLFESQDPDYLFVRAGIEGVLGQTGGDPYKEHYTRTILSAHEDHLRFKAALSRSRPTDIPFPQSKFGQNLRMIADTIAAREAVGETQQLFFVNYGGWDHHDDVLNQQNTMLGDLAESLYAFDAALAAMGAQDQVTSFTISDFGRTLTSNGNGSDHGWGGNIMVMGGSVKGGRILGQYPELTLGGDLDIGSGIFVPTLPTDALYASLGTWFGAKDRDLHTLLPNLSKFTPAQQGLDLMN